MAATKGVEIIPATEMHARMLARAMRPADVEEMKASYNLRPLDGCLYSVRNSNVTWALYVGGQLAALFGVRTLDLEHRAGSVWMLGTRIIEDHPVTFLRASRETIVRLLRHWHTLENAIDARNTKSLAWAKWLGFEIGSPIPFGIQGLPFHPVRLRLSLCALH